MSGDQNQQQNQQKQKGGGGGGNQPGLTFNRHFAAGNDVRNAVRTVGSEAVGLIFGMVVTAAVFELLGAAFPGVFKKQGGGQQQQQQGGGDQIHPGKAAHVLSQASQQEQVRLLRNNPKLLDAARQAVAGDVVIDVDASKTDG